VQMIDRHEVLLAELYGIASGGRIEDEINAI
jgi:hypothetical protein